MSTPKKKVTKADIDNMMIGELRELMIALEEAREDLREKYPFIDQYVIVRTYSAGVHFGYLKAKAGRDVVLSKAQRLWQWSGAFTLSAVAMDGIEDGKISCVVPVLGLTEAIEIIPCSEKAKKNLSEFKVHKPS